MDIIIPMAGHSRRFLAKGYSVPKFLIDIDGRTMIEHVIEMFSSQDTFHFIVNTDQVQACPQLIKDLKRLAARTEVYVIASHEKGPVYSALKIPVKDPNAPVIVSYCDFKVEWDYRRFLEIARQSDGSMAVFRGFHPASMGHTLYAYVRTQGDQMLELREKESFTPVRTEEFASAGIYYFSRWEQLTQYGEEVLNTPDPRLKEGYVSLLFNPMVKSGEKITVFEVDKFICWGTPEDLEQYQYWASHFSGENSNERSSHEGINLIPMAGQGMRFREFGYRVAKPLIQVDHCPMIVKASHSFPKPLSWIYLVSQDEFNRERLQRAIGRSSIENAKFISVPKLTLGPADTCLLAESQIPPESPVFIASCDYEMGFDSMKWQRLIRDPEVDGIIFTFRLKSLPVRSYHAFAYCQLDPDGKSVRKIVEKKVVSEHPENDPMVIGSFWVRHSKDLFWAIRASMESKDSVNGEYYVGTSLNQLLSKGHRFISFDVDRWISYGDPLELRLYEYWQDYFLKANGSEGSDRLVNIRPL